MIDTYTISDLHFGHKNIIRYCNRPFASLYEMDKILVERWNRTVTSTDCVIFVGDLALASGHPREYLRRLNGIKVMIRGNHDRQLAGPVDALDLEYGDERFFFTHYPHTDAIPVDFDGWIVHGHVHDNAPFFDRENRRINVSCEVIEYRPVSLIWLYSLIKSDIGTLQTISDFSQDETHMPTQDTPSPCVQIA